MARGKIAIAFNRPASRIAVVFALAAAAASPALPADGSRLPTTARSAQVTVVERDGFDWTDAGIGALAAFGIVFVVAGISVVARYSVRRPVAAKTRRRL